MEEREDTPGCETAGIQYIRVNKSRWPERVEAEERVS